MNKSSLRLGQILGIPVGLDYSWFLVFALFTWSFATGYYPNEFTNWPTAEYWIVGAVTAVMLFGSVLLHELGHSWVALRYKIPVRSITLYIFGGISQISTEPTSALSEFWITIAGPIVSFALAGLFALLILILPAVAPFLALFKYLAYINLVLGAFNLIPGFPLDGGGVLMAIVWGITHNRHRALLFASVTGNLFAYLFIFYGALQIFGGNLMNGLWTAFIGWFLLTASRGQVQQERIKGILSGHKVAEAMSRNYTAIQSDTTLQDLIDDHIFGGGRRNFIVEKDGQVIGLLTQHQLKAIPEDQWSTTKAAQAMLPASQLKQIGLDTELWEAIEEMDRDGVNQLPVIDEGQIQGMLTREDLISYLRVHR
ncbi:MAG: site-2 protease family protein [Anaerolineaceae bacterium]|nr:site-2 protease family protein [Anaerolineaceae bacterium]